MERNRGSLGQYRKWAGVNTNQTGSEGVVGFRCGQNQYELDRNQSPPVGASAYDSQMMTLKMRMTQAKQQNILAHQRLANHMLQGSDQRDFYLKANVEKKNSESSPIEHFLGKISPDRSSPIFNNDLSATSNAIEKSTASKFAVVQSPASINDNTHTNEPLEAISTGKSFTSESFLPPSGIQKTSLTSVTENRKNDPPLRLPVVANNNEAKSLPVEHENAAARIDEDIKPQVSPQLKSLIIHELTLLAEDVKHTVAANTLILGETNENRKVKEHEKSEEVVYERRRKLRELLAIRVEDGIVLMPLWRHMLMGDFNPRKDTILKGKKLFQVIVWSIIVMCLQPMLTLRKRKIERRDRERSDLARTLGLYADATKSWISKGVRFPVATLEQDVTLDFEPKQHPFEVSAAPFQFRMMQLKVRVKAIVKCMSALEMPPHNITDFFIGLVDEGNYFPPGFLWRCEAEMLEFNSLGGVVRLITPHIEGKVAERSNEASRVPFSDSPTHSGRFFMSWASSKSTCRDTKRLPLHDPPPTTTNKNIISLTDKPEDVLNIGRVRMLLQNFVLVRILVGHLLLSPWSSSICRRPSKRKGRIIYNCRVAATLVYEVVQMVDALSSLPQVGATGTPVRDNARRSFRQSFIRSISSVPRNLNMGAGKGVGPGKGVGLKGLGVKMVSLPEEEPQSKVVLLFEKAFGIASAPLLDDKGSNLERPRGDVEEQLLGARSHFEPLPVLHGYLLKPATLTAARPLINEWLKECSEELDQWMSRLVLHVLDRRAKKIAEKKAKKVDALNW